MSASPRNATLPAQRGPALRVPSYEKAASLLISLLILIGVVVVCLVVAWYSARVFEPMRSIPVILDDVGGGFEAGVIGDGMEIEAPQDAEIAQETDLEKTELTQVLEAIDTIIATREADLDDILVDAEDDDQPTGGGRSTGTGDQLALGRGGGGAGIPRHERWEIRFDEGSTIEDYAAQLDFFEIELGVLRGLGEVEYAYNLAKATPDSRIGRRADEDRLYMTWSEGDKDAAAKRLEAADRELLRRAGVDSNGKNVLQFFSPDTENRLAFYEQEFKGLKGSAIRRTRFGVRQQGGQFDFYVIDQTPL